MSFSQFIIILKARWKIILGVFFAIVGLVLAVSLLLPKKYTASAAVLIDVKSPDPIAGMVLPAMLTPGYIATQLDVLQSERVARGAIKALRLDENPQLREQWKDQTDGVGSFESWLASLLQQNLEIVPSRESSVINVAYTAVNPQFAAVVANAFVRSYIDTTVELRVEPAKQYATLFETQARQARERLEETQSKLSAYQREKGLIANDERLDVETSRLNELSTQLVALQAMTAESRSRQAHAGSSSQEVLNNPVVATLKSDLSRQEARLKELTSRFGGNYPQVLETQASINELRARIDAETARVTSSVGINSTVAQQREAQIRKELENQREKVLRLKEQRDEASVLLRDVENAQRAYDALGARISQSSVESQSNQTNVAVMREASPPSNASSPKILLNMILAVLVGGLVSLATALLLELRDRRLRSEEDIVNVLELPLLGVMPTPDGQQGRKFLGRSRGPQLPRRALPELASPSA